MTTKYSSDLVRTPRLQKPALPVVYVSSFIIPKYVRRRNLSHFKVLILAPGAFSGLFLAPVIEALKPRMPAIATFALVAGHLLGFRENSLITHRANAKASFRLKLIT